MAFTGVGRLGGSLRGGHTGLRREGGGGGHVLWVRNLLTFLDLLHLTPDLLLPVCSTVDETRAVRDALLESTGLYRVLLELSGFYRFKQGSTVVYWWWIMIKVAADHRL